MKLAITLVAMALLAAGGTRDEPVRAQQGAGSDVTSYAWDGACKDCHTDVYESWAKTKHATALNRLTVSERQQECVGCHVTGADRVIEIDGTAANSNVQCESCHGPGRVHIESTKAGGPGTGNIVQKPASTVCERCHNKKSPHFKGFFYDAMLGFVHRTKARG
jgi:hypothetical protein